MDEAIIEKAARAAALADGCDPDHVDHTGAVQWTYHVPLATAMLRAVIPLIEAAAFERAAGVATQAAERARMERKNALTNEDYITIEYRRNEALDIAAVIRSLKEKQNGPA